MVTVTYSWCASTKPHRPPLAVVSVVYGYARISDVHVLARKYASPSIFDYAKKYELIWLWTLLSLLAGNYGGGCYLRTWVTHLHVMWCILTQLCTSIPKFPSCARMQEWQLVTCTLTYPTNYLTEQHGKSIHNAATSGITAKKCNTSTRHSSGIFFRQKISQSNASIPDW